MPAGFVGVQRKLVFIEESLASPARPKSGRKCPDLVGDAHAALAELWDELNWE
jgi:hypothetical protein